MKKILLVEDDDQFRSALKAILAKKYEVFEANNGKTARDLLTMMEFELILSDVQMPFFSGVELLEWVKAFKPTPFILMTGFSHILETKKAHELGADEFLAKPFKEEELFEKVQLILKDEQDAAQPPKPAENLDEEFCKVPIEDFVVEKETEYGIYIRVSQTKYIKIAHNGGKLSEERIATFKEKGVTHLYLKKEDFSRLVGFTLRISKAISQSPVDKEKKIRFMQYTGEMIMQQAYVAGTDEALFKNAKDFLTSSLNVLTEDDETFSLLSLLSSHTDYLYAHSLGVSMFSVMIAKQLGWQSSQMLFKLATAGLFHDIGKKEIAVELLEKPRSLLTQQERALLETHTTRGLEILQSLKSVPAEVIQVAYEHHEDILGQGFPQGLTKPKIHPLSLIVSVANIFCEYTIRGPHCPVPRTAQAALQAMCTFKKGALDPQGFEALAKVIKDHPDVVDKPKAS